MRTNAMIAVITSALLLSACSSPQHQSGDAAPAGSAAAPTTSATSAAPSATPSTTPAASAASSNGGTAPLVLGPLGYGALRLGMTKEQALATGLVTAFEVTNPPCATAKVPDATGDRSWVMLSPRLGVMAINAWGTLATAEGVHIGTSVAEARRIYPNWYTADGTADDGRHYPKVPGNENAVYRIVTDGKKVTEITLQLARQDCYE